MKVYHGSKRIIETPIVHGSNPSNDYGPAFYITREIESAHEWACRNNTIGVVNVYQLNIEGLTVLDLRDYSPLHWIAILLHFRTLDDGFKNSFAKRLEFLEDHYFIDVDNYDMVIGYRADDAYFRFPLDFIRGNITLEQLEASFANGDLGIQYALISSKAINSIKFVNKVDSSQQYINKYFDRVRNATKAFDELDKDIDGTRIQDIMRGNKWFI